MYVSSIFVILGMFVLLVITIRITDCSEATWQCHHIKSITYSPYVIGKRTHDRFTLKTDKGTYLIDAYLATDLIEDKSYLLRISPSGTVYETNGPCQ